MKKDAEPARPVRLRRAGGRGGREEDPHRREHPGPLSVSESQVELCLTDARSIGVKRPHPGIAATWPAPAPLQVSVGPKGEVALEEGVIAAKRHIHMTPADAEALGLRG